MLWKLILPLVQNFAHGSFCTLALGRGSLSLDDFKTYVVQTAKRACFSIQVQEYREVVPPTGNKESMIPYSLFCKFTNNVFWRTFHFDIDCCIKNFFPGKEGNILE